MTTTKEQIQKWVEDGSSNYVNQGWFRLEYGNSGNTAKECRQAYHNGAHSMIEPLMVAIDCLQKYESAAFEVNGQVYKVGSKATDALDKIQKHFEIKE